MTIPTIYSEYKHWRSLGFSALTAYLISKMGFFEYLMHLEYGADADAYVESK